ncbi:hypothetical protein DPMN_182271 [Dreissena polymorpha]|uniref:Uncharacterized protein n=1 Tax=Dreissena polymorpha TaxID=45954 RepID=A0A9D4DEF7_DREPO|nr:hypothetical protein DPMN_182271 [Dreissena polymorpha]
MFRQKMKNFPVPGGHVFQQSRTISGLGQDIIRTNHLSKTDVLTRFHYSHIWKTALLSGVNFSFDEDWTKNVTSRVLTRKTVCRPWWPCFSTTPDIGLDFHEDLTKNFLTKFHEDGAINVASRVLQR